MLKFVVKSLVREPFFGVWGGYHECLQEGRALLLLCYDTISLTNRAYSLGMLDHQSYFYTWLLFSTSSHLGLH